MTFEPVRIDVGAQLSLNPQAFGVPLGVDASVSTPNQQSGVQFDPSDNLDDLPGGNVIFASTAFHAAFQLVTVTVRGELSIGLGFSYLGTKYDKRVKVPFGLSLPFVVPTVHVDALWHHRLSGDPAHQWLRETLYGLARQVFDA